MLYHTYADLDEAKRFLVDNGTSWSEGSTNDARARGVLESVSRRVDDWCQRSAFGSGFGPRTGTNRYDGAGESVVDLHDDAISLATVTVRSTTGASGSTATLDTDYYLRNQRGGYEPGPYRAVVFHGQGSVVSAGTGLRVTECTTSWGYEDRTVALSVTASAIGGTTTTSVTVSAANVVAAGQTLLIDTEQLYVLATSGTTLTVLRGVNGTTAATHGAASAIARYVYDPRVSDATLRLFLRRWRMRDGDGTGLDGGAGMGVVQPRESEETILRRAVGELRLGARVALVAS